jgi:hypothetical protein
MLSLNNMILQMLPNMFGRQKHIGAPYNQIDSLFLSKNDGSQRSGCI